MDVKEFAQKAIKNGHTGNGLCAGWDWIRDNLHELDYIFQTDEYKKQDGMKYKCKPLLERTTLTSEEKSAIETAWYLNNGRERSQADEAYAQAMAEKGFAPLTEDIVKTAHKQGKKIQLDAKISQDWASFGVTATYNPYVSADEKTVMLMKPRARTRGYYLTRFESAFCKIV